MKTRKIMALVLSIVMVFSLCSTAFAAHLTDEVTELETRNSDISVEMAKQSYVLLENNGVLPLLDTEKSVAIFGAAAEDTVKGGTGSGDVNQRSRDNIDEAFVAAGWEIANPTWLAKMAEQEVSGGCMGAGVKDDMEITAEELAEAKATDLAVYAISRQAGEGADRTATEGDYFLSAVERANIELLAANFDRFVIVFNTCVIDTGWVSEIEGIDAIVYMSNGGQRGSEALVAVLEGEVTPSGKLTDTWPVNYTDYPSAEGFSSNDGNTDTEYYTEGIYVGYRYFDTFGVDVSYEFGYGLSYTEFDIAVTDVAVSGDSIDVTVDVANVGGVYSGKEVVQVYFSAPDGELEKPYQELAAFGKTAELAPGEKQSLTISYATQDMSSYSEELAAYVMEAGDYIIRVGNSSRNTQVAAVATLAETTITEQLSNQVTPEIEIDELSNEGATPITYAGEAAEIAAAPKYVIENLPYANNASEFDAETAYTYLFAEDYESYVPAEEVTIRGNTVAGILRNGDGTGNGYQEVTYAEEKVLVDALPEGITPETAKLSDVYDGKITLRQFVACLSIEEMARLCVGGAGNIEAAPDGTMIGAQASSVQGGAGQTTQALFQTRHIPSVPNADGPAGIRITQHYTRDGVDYYQFCTAFPVGTCYAGSWNTDLYTQMGDVIGSEMIEYGVTHWLAPALNIHRNALCGRNFEYYSEDPYLSGITAAYVTAAVQSYEGIGTTLKHYWGNSQEDNRNAANGVISERAAREIYLKGFEIAVKLAQPMCIMTCYNVNNGRPGADDHDSNYDLTRGEWGFKGMIMTDWGGGQATGYIEMHAGNDMVMPGGDPEVILEGFEDVEPTWAEDGFVLVETSQGWWGPSTTYHWGEFVPTADGDVTIEVPVVGGLEAVNEDVWAYVDAGSAMVHANEDGSYSVVWTGWYPGNIVKGDLQKAAYNVLNVIIQTQDMAKMYAAEPFNQEISVGSYSANNGALLTTDWAQAEAGEVVDAGLVADTVVVDLAADTTAAVNVTYTGEEAITSARFVIDSELPFASIEVAEGYEMENNNGYVVIYAADGSEIDGVLCTINYELPAAGAWVANGSYAIGIDVVEATNMDEELTLIAGVGGAIVVENTYAAGDANLDGVVTNADVIAIARYLVDLVVFNAEQMVAADVNEDGIVNNIDLIMVARALIA